MAKGKSSPGPVPRIAVVDDDDGAREHLRTALELHGYSVEAFSTPGTFLDSLSKHKPDAVLLDLQMPGVGGWEVLKAVKENPELRSVLVLLISGAYRNTKDLVRGLEMGADDYMTKPIPPDFLLARLEALLRRVAWRSDLAPVPRLRLGPLTIDEGEHTVRLNDQEVRLTPLEFELLAFMVQHPNRVLTRGLILEKVWKSEPSMNTRTVDKHVESLRKKLGAVGKKIDTVVGVGYVLRP